MNLQTVLSLPEGTRMKIVSKEYPAYPREGELRICTKEELDEDHEGQPFGLVFWGPAKIGQTVLKAGESAVCFEFDSESLEIA